MAPRSVLYLTVEGVLVPRLTACKRPPESGLQPLEAGLHMERLTNLLTRHHQISVVLNTSLVPSLGFHNVLQLLPGLLRGRIIGATAPGNRFLRAGRLSLSSGRCAWLAADVRRRCPERLAVLEYDARCVPVPLRDRAIIVSRGLWAATTVDWDSLQDLLTDMTTANSANEVWFQNP